MDYLKVAAPSMARDKSDIIVDGKAYKTSLDENGIRRLTPTNKYSDNLTVNRNSIPIEEHVDRALNGDGSVCYLYDVLDSQSTPHMIHNAKEEDNSIRTTYDDIQGYHDTVLLCGDTVILYPSMVHIFGAGLSEYVDPNYTGKYKELHGYHYSKDGKQVIRCAVIPANIIEIKPTLTILLSVENLPFRKFHNFKQATELAVASDSLDDAFWDELRGLLDFYGAEETINNLIMDDSIPAVVKSGSTIKLELYNLGAYYSNKSTLPKLDVMSYRAECQGDVFEFSHTLIQNDMCHRITKFEPDLKLGEVLIEMEYWNCEYNDIIEVLKEQQDSHVMYETCRPVAMSENSMERK